MQAQLVASFAVVARGASVLAIFTFHPGRTFTTASDGMARASVLASARAHSVATLAKCPLRF